MDGTSTPSQTIAATLNVVSSIESLTCGAATRDLVICKRSRAARAREGRSVAAGTATLYR